MIGASGAVAGVLGAYLVLYPRARVLSVFTLGFIFPVVVRAGLDPARHLVRAAGRGGRRCRFRHPDVGVAFFAHVGGFLAGMGLGFVLARRPRRRASRRA